MSKAASTLGSMEIEGKRCQIVARFERAWVQANRPDLAAWMVANKLRAILLLERPYTKARKGYTAYEREDGTTYPYFKAWEGTADLG